jgi:hypothetical protein
MVSYILYLNYLICELKYLINVHVLVLVYSDIDECSTPERYSCYGECKNTPGSFLCLCPAGYKGNASVPNGCKGTVLQYDTTTQRLIYSKTKKKCTSNNKQCSV